MTAMRRRRIVARTLLVAGLLALLAPSGCLWEERELPPALSGDPVLIGIPLPLSGSKAAFGEAKLRAYEMAVEEINAAGGVSGRPLALVVKDTAGEPDTAAAAARELIKSDGVTLLAGEYSSTCALAVAAVAQEYSLPYLVDSAAADDITQQKWSYVFRLNAPASLYASGLWSFFGQVVKPRTMAIVYEHTDYGTSVARAMRSWCRDQGISIEVDASYEPGDLDFGPLVDRVREAAPDVVYVVSYLVDASLFIRQARSAGLAPGLFAGGAAGFVMPEFITNTGPGADGVVTAALWAPSVDYPGAEEFAETFRARYGEYPTYHAAESYACIYVIDDALRRAASTAPERVRVALADTELVTVFGAIRFEKFGKYLNQCRAGTIVLQVQKGRHEVIWPPECATAEYVYPDPAASGPGESGQ